MSIINSNIESRKREMNFLENNFSKKLKIIDFDADLEFRQKLIHDNFKEDNDETNLNKPVKNIFQINKRRRNIYEQSDDDGTKFVDKLISNKEENRNKRQKTLERKLEIKMENKLEERNNEIQKLKNRVGDLERDVEMLKRLFQVKNIEKEDMYWQQVVI